MDTQVWNNALLLIVGGVLTVLGAWLNDLRSERRRKNAKLEEAYLAWLNTESSILGRLKELTKLAENEPESLQSHELLLEKLVNLHSDLQNLTSALHLALIYERNREKKTLVENQVKIYSLLAEKLRLIVSHHKTHLKFHLIIDQTTAMLDRANTLVAQAEERVRSSVDGSDIDEVGKAAEQYQTVQRYLAEVIRVRDESNNHLSTCASSLSDAAKRLSKDVERIEERSTDFRKVLID
jgi:hypothetical protein